MQNTNQDLEQQLNQVPVRGGYTGFNNVNAAMLVAGNQTLMQRQGMGVISEMQAQQRQLNNQSLASANFVSPVTNQFQEPNTPIQNPQPQTLGDLRRDIVGNGAGVLQENNDANENIESKKNLTDLAKRQPNQRSQPIAIDSQQINSQRPTQSVGVDSQPAGKRSEPGILQRWSAGGMKNLKKFTDSILLENHNLDDPKPKK